MSWHATIPPKKKRKRTTLKAPPPKKKQTVDLVKFGDEGAIGMMVIKQEMELANR